MSLRCVYTDLDGTMLGADASLLRDAQGNFSLLAVRALEACHRADVEVVIKSGRRRPQVAEDARLIGQRSYIYELGCGVVDGLEEELFVAPFASNADTSVHDQIESSGVVALLFEHFPGSIEYHAPWHRNRQFTHLLRGSIDLAEAHDLMAQHGHTGVRLVDNGVTGRRSESLDVDGLIHVYHLIPASAGKGNAISAHMTMRGYAPAECIAIGDSRGDVESADAVGRFFLVANGVERDPEIASAIGGRDNVTITDEAMTAGFYEAVVRGLAEG
ncbi:MAG: HAD hydrolase family protein [Solirubrobacterales bacterium]